MLTLNPVLRIDTQIIEAIRAHADVGSKQAREWAQRAADQGHPAGRLLLTKLPRR